MSLIAQSAILGGGCRTGFHLPWLLRLAQRARPVLGLPLLFFIGIASLMASSARLHACIHEDAGDPSHECLAVLLEHHQLVVPDSDAIHAIALAAPRVYLLVPPRLIFADFSHSVASSRAPPVLFPAVR